MRIVMLAQFYPPIIGGEEHQVRRLSQMLAHFGHEVAVATLWREGLPEYEVDEGVRVYRLRGTVQRAEWLYKEKERRHAPPFPDPEMVWNLRRVLKRESPQIVHAHNWIVHSFLPIKRWSGAKLVVTLHDYSLGCVQKRLMNQNSPCSGPRLGKCLACASEHYGVAKGVATVLANWTMSAVERSLVDMFLPVSYAVAQGAGLVDNHLPFQVIPNLAANHNETSTSEYAPYLDKLPKGDFLLFVGDMTRDKGTHVLLQAYAGLKEAPTLVMIGRKYVDTPTEMPANVMALGSWPHGAVIEAWKRSLLGLVPSMWAEPFGIVALEAMAAGRAVIASHTGGLTDIVLHGKTGLLTPPGDADALRRAIEQLLANPTQCKQMGEAGKQRIAEFQAHNVVPRVEHIYQALLRESHMPLASATCHQQTREQNMEVS